MVEAALQLQAAAATLAVVLTLAQGNRKIKDTIKEALAMGADDAFIVTDDALIGADQGARPWPSPAIEKIGGADVIIFGEGSTDGYPARWARVWPSCWGLKLAMPGSSPPAAPAYRPSAAWRLHRGARIQPPWSSRSPAKSMSPAFTL